MSTRLDRRSFLKAFSAASLGTLLNGLPISAHGASNVPSAVGAPAEPGAPNILFVVFDALSAMDMSLYGYRRKTTPVLEKLAERATVYHAHYAGGNYTTPGTSSLLTGVHAWSHRAFNVQGTLAPAYRERNLFRLLGDVGYKSLAYSNNWTAHLCLYQMRQAVDALLSPSEYSLFDRVIADRLFARDADVAYRTERFFLRGVLLNRIKHMPGSLAISLGDEMAIRRQRAALKKSYQDRYPRGVPNYGTSAFLLEDVIDGIAALTQEARQPFVAYFQPLPPHSPYHPRQDFVGLYEGGWKPEVKARHFFDEGWSDELLVQKRLEYDEFVAFVDAEFGRLYEMLSKNGVLENTYVILTSDHGEMFERGIYQHSTPTLYDPIVRIPLLIFGPGQQQREDVYTPTSCIDLLPTCLHLCGQAIPDWCEGQVLSPFVEGTPGASAPAGQRGIFTMEAKSNLQHAPLNRATVAMIVDQHKLVHYFGYKGHEDQYELYDLSNDPEEVDDLSTSHPSLVAELGAEIDVKLREVNEP